MQEVEQFEATIVRNRLRGAKVGAPPTGGVAIGRTVVGGGGIQPNFGDQFFSPRHARTSTVFHPSVEGRGSAKMAR